MDVREAARRTIGAGSARVRRAPFFDGEPAHPLMGAFLWTEQGVVDLRRRRARLRMEHSESVDSAVEWAAKRWPWIDDEDEPGEEDGAELERESIVIGDRRYVNAGGRWMLNEYPSQLNNPAWILDALGGAGSARQVGGEEVREVACRRWALDPVDLRAAVGANNGAFELPPHGNVERPTLRGDIWVDAEGLLRRIVWTQPRHGRPRLRGKEPPAKAWTSVEFWDFGLPVAIEVPDAQPPPEYDRLSVRDVWKAGSWLWRKRAAYRRS